MFNRDTILASAVEAGRRDVAKAAAKFPTGSAVSRALRRDAGIIAVPVTRAGYHVRNGMRATVAATSQATIAVSCSDLPDAASDRRDAVELRDHLVELGWDIDELRDGSAILYVNSIPKKGK